MSQNQSLPPTLKRDLRYYLLASGQCETANQLSELASQDKYLREWVEYVSYAQETEAFTEVTINRLYEEGGWYALYHLVRVVQNQLHDQHPEYGLGQTLLTQLDKNRQWASSFTNHMQAKFIERVQTVWVDGVLQEMIGEDGYIPLHYHLSAQEDSLVSIKEMGEWFIEKGRCLFISGQPASGKTTTLLQLAAYLLEQAPTNPDIPIPLVVHLSTWQKQPFLDWLTDELFFLYGLAQVFTQQGLDGKQFALFLDGLETVDNAEREACVRAIRQFYSKYRTPIMLCGSPRHENLCRKHFPWVSVVQIQPLTHGQALTYLEQRGEPTSALRVSLHHLPRLSESPLWLWLMGQVYGETQIPDPLPALETQKHDLWQAYITQKEVTPQQKHWLTHLAIGMTLNKQNIFHIERLQASWLPEDYQKRYQQTLGLITALFGLALTIFFCVMMYIENVAEPPSEVTWQVMGFVFVIGAFFSVWAGRRTYRDPVAIQPEPELVLAWPARQQWGELLFGPLFILLLAGVITAVMTLITNNNVFDNASFTYTMVAFAIVLYISNFLPTRILSTTLQPNQGIGGIRRNRFKWGVVAGLFTMLLYALPLLVLALFFDGVDWIEQAGITLVLGLTFALLPPMQEEGQPPKFGSWLRHYLLRWWLARAKMLPYPFNDSALVAFLDEMAEKGILRRVGSGWQFIHTELRDYLADLWRKGDEAD